MEAARLLREGSASPRSPEKWACIGSLSAAGRGSSNSLECAGCARPNAAGVQRNSPRPSCATWSARLNGGPRRSDLTPGCGPLVGYASSSSTGPECDTIRMTWGASCASLTGPASVPPEKRWSATSRRSGTGRSTAGRRLKKSALRAAHDRLHRRKRIERTAASGQNLGAARADPGAAISLQLEGAFGQRRITWWNFYFRLYRGAIRAPQVIDFLGHLLRHLRRQAVGGTGTGCPPIAPNSSNSSSPSSTAG